VVISSGWVDHVAPLWKEPFRIQIDSSGPNGKKLCLDSSSFPSSGKGLCHRASMLPAGERKLRPQASRFPASGHIHCLRAPKLPTSGKDLCHQARSLPTIGKDPWHPASCLPDAGKGLWLVADPFPDRADAIHAAFVRSFGRRGPAPPSEPASPSPAPSTYCAPVLWDRQNSEGSRSLVLCRGSRLSVSVNGRPTRSGSGRRHGRGCLAARRGKGRSLVSRTTIQGFASMRKSASPTLGRIRQTLR